MLKKIIFPILTILLMGLIFYFSSQTGSESGGLSDSILNAIIKLFYGEGFNNKDVINIWSLIIRKSAHFTIFGLLALLYFLSIRAYKITSFDYIYSILLTFLYASLDEWHQTFTSGRAGLFTDVLIDTAGGIFFLGVAFLVIKLIRYYNRRDSRSDYSE